MTVKDRETAPPTREARLERLFADRSRKCGPQIFGIVNLTADSFSGDGVSASLAEALNRAGKMLSSGAAALDIGAESTRPGAREVPADQETALLLPVIAELRKRHPECVISVDTRHSLTAGAVLDAGADIINDVSGLQFDPAMAGTIAAHSGAGVVIMHMRGTPENMNTPANLHYDDLCGDICSFLQAGVKHAENAGIASNRIIVDPGISFSKDSRASFDLLHHASSLETRLEKPVLWGVSRKSFLGGLCGGSQPCDRDFATSGVLMWLAFTGAAFIRVHNVQAAREALASFCRCAFYQTSGERK